MKLVVSWLAGLSLKLGVWHASHAPVGTCSASAVPDAAADASCEWQRKHAVMLMKSWCFWFFSPVLGSVSVSSKSSTCAVRLWQIVQLTSLSEWIWWSILMPSDGVTLRVFMLWHWVHCRSVISSATSLSALSGSS